MSVDCKLRSEASPDRLMQVAQRNPGVASSSRLVVFLLIGAVAGSGCGTDRAETSRAEPIYDQTTGRLKLLQYDATGDGRIDTWSYMDGARVVRIEMDPDQDSRIDRWEYYGLDQKIEKAEISTRHDGKADRFEYYEGGALARAEVDTSGDGRIDKWEVYGESRLLSVAFDTTQRGTADRRMVYEPDGSARLEQIP